MFDCYLNTEKNHFIHIYAHRAAYLRALLVQLHWLTKLYETQLGCLHMLALAIPPDIVSAIGMYLLPYHTDHH